MLEALDPLRLTALPALLFLAWLPLYGWTPARHARTLLTLASIATVYFVTGPILGTGLVLVVVGGYLLIEAAASLPVARGPALCIVLAALHAGYWGCFHLLIPAPFVLPWLRPADSPSLYVLFSGIGMTFFRLVSYAIDRWRGMPRLPPAACLAYLFFFPQFRHGPIERGRTYAAQLASARARWSGRDVRAGLARTLGGVALFGATLALAAAFRHFLPDAFHAQPLKLLAQPEHLSAAQFFVFLHFPAIGLYLAESSFASMQLGVARTFGVHGTENFRQPWRASDPIDLWRRWNITLMTWLRDYAYRPLRWHRHARYPAVVLVFIYCGLLHAPQWRCVVWGIFTGGTTAIYMAARDALARHGHWPAWLSRHPRVRFVLDIVQRLLTLHWIAISIVIVMDPNHYGGRILERYVEILCGGR